MILLLRGHIRNSFNTKVLYDFIKNIYESDNELKIYIHTWNIFQNNTSWRKIDNDFTEVNEKIIMDYFDDLKHIIKHIIVDDDSKITLIGNTVGNLTPNSPAPLIGWKRYWYSKYAMMEYLKDKIDPSEVILNFRFDLFSNSNNFNIGYLLKFVNENKNMIHNKLKFIGKGMFYGIDNIYIGNMNVMQKLINYFHFELDNIVSKYTAIRNQEFLVFIINEELFKN
jgi:hypothetical protein